MSKSPKHFPKYSFSVILFTVSLIILFICEYIACNPTSEFISRLPFTINPNALSILGIVIFLLSLIVILTMLFSEEPLQTILLLTTIFCGIALVTSIILGIIYKQYVNNIYIEFGIGVGELLGFLGSLFGMNKISKSQT